MSCIFSGTSKKKEKRKIKQNKTSLHLFFKYFFSDLPETQIVHEFTLIMLLPVSPRHNSLYGEQMWQRWVSSCLEDPQLFFLPHHAQLHQMFNPQTPKNKKAKRLKTFIQNCIGTPLFLRTESNLHLSLSSTGEVTPTPRQHCRAEAASAAGNGSSMLTSSDFLHLKDEYPSTAG